MTVLILLNMQSQWLRYTHFDLLNDSLPWLQKWEFHICHTESEAGESSLGAPQWLWLLILADSMTAATSLAELVWWLDDCSNIFGRTSLVPFKNSMAAAKTPCSSLLLVSSICWSPRWWSCHRKAGHYEDDDAVRSRNKQWWCCSFESDVTYSDAKYTRASWATRENSIVHDDVCYYLTGCLRREFLKG